MEVAGGDVLAADVATGPQAQVAGAGAGLGSHGFGWHGPILGFGLRLAVAKYPFLSEQWVAAARALRDEMGPGPAVEAAVRMNQVITDVPFGDGTIDAHLDTSTGYVVMELGHLPDPDVTVTLDYETAKGVFAQGSPQAGIQAFMNGKIRVDGDMAKLVEAMKQTGTAGTDPAGVQQRVAEITE